MAKFNLGDKVRVSYISLGDFYTPVKVGATGKVVALANDSLIGVYFDEDIDGHNCRGINAERLGDEYFRDSNCWWFTCEKLELIKEENDMNKIKLGDIVIVKNNAGHECVSGMTGKVVAIATNDSPGKYGVYFEENGGHDCGGVPAEHLNDGTNYFTGGHCWWMTYDEIMVSDDILDRMNEIQTKFAEMYSTTGLVGISSKYVQVTSEFFKKMFDTYTVAPHGNSKTEVLLSAKYNDVEYIALDER